MSVPFSIIIPARYASTRLPGKPLLDIQGKPLIQHVYEQAGTSAASHIYIATDDERVAEVCTAFGADTVMTSDNHESGTDRLAEVISKKNIKADEIIVNVQGDEFGLPSVLIDQVATGLHAHTEASVATLCEPVTNVEDYRNPNVVKVVFDRHQHAMYFSRSPLPAIRNGDMPDKVYRHIGLYAYRAGYLKEFAGWPASQLEQSECLEQLRVLENGDCIFVDIATCETGIGVDTSADLERARANRENSK